MPNNTRNIIITLSALWVTHFFVDFMIGIWAVYKTIAELDLAICGLIAGVSAFAGEGMQAVFGSLSDKGYRFHLIIFGVLLSAASTLLAYFESYFALFFLFLITCIGSGAFHPCAASLINSLPNQRKSLLMSIFQSGGGLGLAFSQMIFAYTYFTFEGNTFILAIPTILLAILLMFQQKIFTCFDSKTPTKKASLKKFAEFFRHPLLSRLYIAQVCNTSIMWGMLFLLPDILVSRGYDPWICFGGGHLALVLGSTLFVVPAGFLADRYSQKHVILYAFVFSIIALYTFLLLPFFSIPMLLTTLFILGACLGMASPIIISFGNLLAPNNSGMVSAFLMGLVWCVSEGIGQFGGGLLSKLFIEDAPARALGCLGILFFIGLAACIRLPKYVSSSEIQLIPEPIKAHTN